MADVYCRSRVMLGWKHVFGLGLLISVMALAACSTGDDDPTATAGSSEQPTATPATGDATATLPTATESDAVEPSATTASPETPTTAASATAPEPTATATVNPLPSGGAELAVEGTPIEEIIAVGTEGETLYGISADGLLRSDDGGAHWEFVGEAQDGTIITSGNAPDMLYSGDRASCGRGFSEIPFAESSDSGAAWTVVEANQGILPLLAYTEGEQAVLYGTDCGLKISTDGGATWTPVADLQGEDIFAVAAEEAVAPARLLVVGVTEGGTGRLFLLETADVNAPALAGALTQFWANAVVDWSEGRIVLATAHEVGVSDDGGQTWGWTRAGLEDVTYSVNPLDQGIPTEEQASNFGFTSVVIDPTNRDRIWLGSNHGAFLSGDGGASWTALDDGERVDSIVISTASERVFISSGGTTRVWSLDGQ